jgi:hypothetical protein
MIPYPPPSTAADRIRAMLQQSRGVGPMAEPGYFDPTGAMPMQRPRPVELDPQPMPSAMPQRQFVPQDPKPMPKPRAPVRMDAPTRPTRRY